VKAKVMLTTAAGLLAASAALAGGGQPWGDCYYQSDWGSYRIFGQYQPCLGVDRACTASQCNDGNWTYLCLGSQDICNVC